MSEQEPRALADLARALETKIMLRDWMELTVAIQPDGYASLTVRCLPVPPDNIEETRHSYLRIAPEHREAVAKALWQAPPSPDAGAFMRAVERLVAFTIHALRAGDQATKTGDTADIDKAESAKTNYEDAHTALLAFAPGVRITPTISESDVDAGAKALWKLVCGDDPQTDDDHAQTVETVRVVLEAVAAARQRATGSGVTGCGG